MNNGLELNHLRTLDALYTHKNVTSAAEHLNISQQAISLQLKKIRTILNDRLFISSGQGVAPTPYAKEIEPYIQDVLFRLNQIPVLHTIKIEEIKRTLSISATDYAQSIIVNELIKELRVFAPKVKLSLINIESANLLKRMRQGEIDLAFTSTGYVPQGLSSQSLFTEKYVCVSGDSSLKTNNPLPIAELIKYDFIVTSPGVASFKGSADPWFQAQGLSRNVVASVPSFSTAIDYIIQSKLVCFLPSRLMPREGLFEIPLEKYPPGYEVVAAFLPNAKNDPLIAWILERLHKRF